ncbi:MAG: glycosyltransferase family 2 protein [bacterium]
MNTCSPGADAPILTIITVVRNGAATLDACIQSVIAHQAPSVEYVVIDGGSTDGTVDLLRRYDDQIAFWSSEPDKGIYDAMNKGVCRAAGDWILFLGSDDTLAVDLAAILPLLQDKQTIYYGNAWWRQSRRTYDGPFSASKLALTNLCHQAVFYPRQALLKYPFNLKYHTQADWEVNMRCFSDPAFRFQYFPKTIANYDDASGISSIRRDLILEQDYLGLLWRHFPWPVALWRSTITLGGRALRKLGWKGRPPYAKR